MATSKELLDRIGSVDFDKIPEPRNKQIDKMISYLDVNDEDLSNWEKEFLYDVHIRFSKNQGVSEGQFDKLVEIYNRHLS